MNGRNFYRSVLYFSSFLLFWLRSNFYNQEYMPIQTYIIDAFTDKPFAGNPAGVCLLETAIEVSLMQSIANELHFSETAFLREIGKNQYAIRYFTPTVEIDFCGHATLASAKLVLDKLGKDSVTFLTMKDLKIEAEYKDGYIKMEFPLYRTEPYAPDKKLYEAFGITEPLAVKFCKELDMLVVEVSDKQTLLNLKPNYQKAIECPQKIKELVVTTKSTDVEYDFYSRCFCPWIGIDEDPVTGAAHCVLATYWGSILDKKEMSAYQLSNRGGFLKLKILGQNTLEVQSNAQIVFEGLMHI